MTIVYPSLMSAVCNAQLPELCQDASCENPQHDYEDLEPLDLSAEADDASFVEYDRRAEKRADV